jgi:hypothetical protein
MSRFTDALTGGVAPDCPRRIGNEAPNGSCPPRVAGAAL